jgi:Ni2+-binding GTPase involved in maturation of urease and hydrogenase
MRLIIVAGPPSAGKTTLTRQIIKGLQNKNKVSYLKIDVVRAFEDEELKKEFGIPTKKIYSGDLCPDHAGIMVLMDAVVWAEKNDSDLLIVESAGLCLRCSPYVTEGLGIVVLSAISGTNTPLKMGPMITLADLAVVTKIDLISQAEREVFREKIKEVNGNIDIIETNALQGTGMRYLMRIVDSLGDIDKEKMMLKGEPPLGVCTICIGKKDIGWQNHFGVIRRLEDADYLYRGD